MMNPKNRNTMSRLITKKGPSLTGIVEHLRFHISNSKNATPPTLLELQEFKLKLCAENRAANKTQHAMSPDTSIVPNIQRIEFPANQQELQAHVSEREKQHVHSNQKPDVKI